jgi:hypothetical protein
MRSKLLLAIPIGASVARRNVPLFRSPSIPSILEHRRLSALAVVGLAGLSLAATKTAHSDCVVPLRVEQTSEAEAGYLQNGVILEDSSASGGEFVQFGAGGTLLIELQSETNADSLVLKYRSPEVDRAVDVSIDNVSVGSFLCRAASDPGTWGSIPVNTPFATTGSHLVEISLTGDSSAGAEFDCMTTCETPVGDLCPGCASDAVPPASVFVGSHRLVLPPLSEVVHAVEFVVDATAPSILEVKTVKIASVAAVPAPGKCEQKPKIAEKPCGDKECVEKEGCSIAVTITFQAKNYITYKFWDTTEEVTLPSGRVESFIRASPNQTVAEKVTGKCGQGQKAVFKFEWDDTRVEQAFSCAKCDDGTGH